MESPRRPRRKRKHRRGLEAQQRAKMARYFTLCIRTLGIPLKEIGKALGMDARRFRKLEDPIPQLEVLYAIGEYIEQWQKRVDPTRENPQMDLRQAPRAA